jgi:hypothetical protein
VGGWQDSAVLHTKVRFVESSVWLGLNDVDFCDIWFWQRFR